MFDGLDLSWDYRGKDFQSQIRTMVSYLSGLGIDRMLWVSHQFRFGKIGVAREMKEIMPLVWRYFEYLGFQYEPSDHWFESDSGYLVGGGN